MSLLSDIFSSVFFVCGTIIIVIITGVLIGVVTQTLLEFYRKGKKK